MPSTPTHPPIELFVYGSAPSPAWSAALDSAGFAWQATPSVDALRAALHRTGDAVCGVLLDLRGVDDTALLQRLIGEIAEPRVRSLCVQRGDATSRPALFELALRYCIDNLVEPVDPQVLALALDSLHRRLRLIAASRAQHDAATQFDEMIGTSAAMQRLFAQIEKVAAADVPVFVAGETGVGKELAARAIHRLSARRDKPFVAINCGSIPPHLLQSELFGYERGAFTGATQRKIGRIEAASGGTLLLDEIGDLPLDAQVGLLRFLQEGRIERLGGTTSTAADARVISATHVDLAQAQRDGRFRSDLYHRLCVVELEVPPLRARGDDVERLARHALEQHARDAPRRIADFTDDALHAMRAHPWPGNVRELINRVRRAMVMCDGERIDAADLGLADAAPPARSLDEVRDLAIRRAIALALERNQRTVVRAAGELGVSRATLYRLMERHGINHHEP
jgi:DNA-binding NtrC family response regulator